MGGGNQGAGLLAGCPGPKKSTCVPHHYEHPFLAFSLVVLMEVISMGTWRAGDVQVTFALDGALVTAVPNRIPSPVGGLRNACIGPRPPLAAEPSFNS